MPRLGALPAVTAKQMSAIDRLLTRTVGIDQLQLNEHDAQALTVVAHEILKKLVGKKIIVVFGADGNGSSGLAAARLLYAAGAQVSLVAGTTQRLLSATTARQLRIVKKLGLKVVKPSPQRFRAADLIIDALLGCNSVGEPRGTIKDLIELMNKVATPLLAHDIPSGLDPDKGSVHKTIVIADYTVTHGLPKIGLVDSSARRVRGKVYLADCGIPASLYAKIGITYSNPFSGAPVIKLT